MSRSINRVELLGHVGSNPEIHNRSGKKVAKLSLATNPPPVKDDRTGEWKDRPAVWHRVTLFDRLAEVVEKFVESGTQLYVSGRLQYGTTTDAEGQTRYWTDIIGTGLILLGGRQSGGDAGTQRGAAPAPDPFDQEGDDDDLPF